MTTPKHVSFAEWLDMMPRGTSARLQREVPIAQATIRKLRLGGKLGSYAQAVTLAEHIARLSREDAATYRKGHLRVAVLGTVTPRSMYVDGHAMGGG